MVKKEKEVGIETSMPGEDPHPWIKRGRYGQAAGQSAGGGKITYSKGKGLCCRRVLSNAGKGGRGLGSVVQKYKAISSARMSLYDGGEKQKKKKKKNKKKRNKKKVSVEEAMEGLGEGADRWRKGSGGRL